jgi:hypothetical protein
MADVKISGLPASTVPLAGTEVLPIVQGGQTRQVSVNNLTAGKAVSATQYTSTIVTGTAPLIVASTTEVANLRAANATSADTANQVKSNATTGVLQVAGPGTGTTRVMTTPDANFTAARTDAAQTFTGTQSVNSGDINVKNGGNVGGAGGFVGFGANNGNDVMGIIKGDLANTASGADQGSLVIQTRPIGAGVQALRNVAVIGANGDTTLSIGNLVIGTSGKGIDFSATAGTGTSELLADYEEGTFTPVPTSATGSITAYTSAGNYTKVGNVVTAVVYVKLTTVGTAAGNLTIGGLPFTSKNTSGNADVTLSREQDTGAGFFNAIVFANSTNAFVFSPTYNNGVAYVFTATYLAA